jgi:hypothetical protein
MLVFVSGIAAMTKTQRLILDQLDHMRRAIDDVCEDMREVKSRFGNLVSQFDNLIGRFGGLLQGLDVLDIRLERIERRLEAIERRC